MRNGPNHNAKPHRTTRFAALPASVLAAYEREVLSDPRTTSYAARKWLADRGYPFSLSAVVNHRRRYLRAAEGRRHAALVGQYVKELAEALGLSPQQLEAGRLLRGRLRLLEEMQEAFSACDDVCGALPAKRLKLYGTAVRGLVAGSAGRRPRGA